jgi:hypothetical protein
MKPATKTLTMVALTIAAAAAVAQPPAASSKPGATAQSEAGEPRADTSNPPPAAPAGAERSNAGNPGAARPARGAGGVTGTGTAVSAAAGAPAGPKSAAKTDRLDLGTATVTGDREQPKVMYIVPWKRSDIGDLAGKPMNSLVDEILAPVDRDVFKREVLYYRAVQADASQNGAPPKPAQQGEK